MMKKNNLTELVFILDCSGSMHGLERDTVGGFNSMIEQQKQQEGEVYVSTVLFNHRRRILHDRVKLDRIKKMTEETYTVSGCTALIDAIGSTIDHIANIHKYARPEDVPAHTLFVITTDGMENVSHEYSSDAVKKMIERKKKQDGWEFIFIGANIDAVETAAAFGIDSNRAVNYHADSIGTRIIYENVAKAACQMRACGPIDDSWRKDIDEDYEARK